MEVIIPERTSSRCGGYVGEDGEACVVVSAVMA
jgi:hypothetical protein